MTHADERGFGSGGDASQRGHAGRDRDERRVFRDEAVQAGPWRGPTDSVWLSRILRGAGLAPELPVWFDDQRAVRLDDRAEGSVAIVAPDDPLPANDIRVVVPEIEVSSAGLPAER